MIWRDSDNFTAPSISPICRFVYLKFRGDNKHDEIIYTSFATVIIYTISRNEAK